MDHVCGLQGFGALGDICEACHVDYMKRIGYRSSHQTGKSRSNAMDDYEGFGDFDDSDEIEDPRNLRNFLSKLESFLDEELDDENRGNVFMAKNGDGVSMNILVGAHFQEDDEEINQVNIIISPTDRSLLSSTGVSMDDREYPEDEDDDQ